MHLRLAAALLLTTSLLSPLAGGSAAAAPVDCSFTLGFQTLHDLIPDIVGDCTADETHNPDNGDALQPTTNGLLVWRKADNWTAFTDGATTWINGPCGLQSRPNSVRFPWENGATCAQSGFGEFVGTWQAPNVILVVFDSHYARFRWRTACFPARVSRCSPVEGTASYDGVAELRFNDDASYTPNLTVTGTIITSNAPLLSAHTGVTLAKQDDGVVQLSAARGPSVTLCKPPRDIASCGS